MGLKYSSKQKQLSFHQFVNLDKSVESLFLLPQQTLCYPERNLQMHLLGECDVMLILLIKKLHGSSKHKHPTL